MFILSEVLEDIQDSNLVHLSLKYNDKQSLYEVNKHGKLKQKPFVVLESIYFIKSARGHSQVSFCTFTTQT